MQPRNPYNKEVILAPGDLPLIQHHFMHDTNRSQGYILCQRLAQLGYFCHYPHTHIRDPPPQPLNLTMLYFTPFGSQILSLGKLTASGFCVWKFITCLIYSKLFTFTQLTSKFGFCHNKYSSWLSFRKKKKEHLTKFVRTQN